MPPMLEIKLADFVYQIVSKHLIGIGPQCEGVHHIPPLGSPYSDISLQKFLQVLLGLLHLNIGMRADACELSEEVRFSVEKIVGNS